jgi:hypothetical protein
MIEITGQRKRNLDRQLRGVPAGAEVVIALIQLDESTPALAAAGFSSALPVGETVLPTPVGNVSKYNAEGDYIIHKDQPMETVTRQIEWTWEQWHGPYTETQSRIIDQEYQRYPRTFREPPSVELTVVEAATDAKAVIASPLAYTDENAEALLHRVNLFLELFGRCTLLTDNLEPFLRVDVQRRNWDVLPPGEWPWEKLERRLQPVLDEFGERTRPVAEHRLRVFTEDYEPDFVAVGRAGFAGYLIFGYEDKGVYVVESLHYGNATYVFGENWEYLARLTKAEILRADLQRDRIIHREDWDQRIADLLG